MAKGAFYDYETMKRLWKTIQEVPLLTPWSFNRAELNAISRSCNGIGPDRWPESVRRLVSKLLHLFEEAAVVHDWEFEACENDGTLERWHEANSRFLENCKRLARFKVSRWRFLRRKAALEAAEVLYAAVESDAGRDAWLAAYERSRVDKSTTPV